ncbi:MAG TPA: DUF1587 domain-containing protein, partial [Polyangiaceae bacterium]|nr:DUF1587 domain-containing protein [Polyangiaceae bacterium]
MPSYRSTTLGCAFALLFAVSTGCASADKNQPNAEGSLAGSANTDGPGGVTPPGSSPAGCEAASADVGASQLRRITNAEYQRTLQDLLELPSTPSIEGLPADTEKDGFKVFTEVQTVSAQHLRGYLKLAQDLGAALMSDAAR